MAKKKETLITEKVYSKVNDKNIKKNIAGSPIWANCYHKDDVPDKFSGFVYSIAFNGTIPVQVKGVKKI